MNVCVCVLFINNCITHTQRGLTSVDVVVVVVVIGVWCGFCGACGLQLPRSSGHVTQSPERAIEREREREREG